MSEIDFNQMESHVDLAINGLRRIQNAGKYPKKVCSESMLGANMLEFQRRVISQVRDDNDRLAEENQKLRDALELILSDADGYTERTGKTTSWQVGVRQLLEQTK